MAAWLLSCTRELGLGFGAWVASQQCVQGAADEAAARCDAEIERLAINLAD